MRPSKLASISNTRGPASPAYSCGASRCLVGERPEYVFIVQVEVGGDIADGLTRLSCSHRASVLMSFTAGRLGVSISLPLRNALMAT